MGVGEELMSDVPTTTLFARDWEGLSSDVLAAVVRTSADGITVLDTDRRVVYANPAACELLGYPLDRLLGHDFLMFVPEWDRPNARAFFAGARCGRPVAVAAAAYRPNGSKVEVEWTTAVLDLPCRQFIVAALRNVTERSRQARQAAALAQAAASVAASESIEATVEAFAECALSGTRALAAWMSLDTEDQIAAWVGAAGVPEGVRKQVPPAACAGAASSIFMQALRAQRVIVYANARQEVELRMPYLAEALKPLPWQASACAPILYRGEIVGLLTAIYRHDELPYEAETTFLATLADQATMAAEQARLVAGARKKAALEERQRLARELHDSVSQTLYGIQLGARVARDRLENDPARLAQPIDHVMRLAESAQAEMGALIFELRSDSLETEGLVANLVRQIDAVRARHGIAGRTTVRDEPRVSIEVKQVLYRIAQEALRNTGMHARARHVDVRLTARRGTVVMEVVDDGVGFDPNQHFPGHLGLRSMRERAVAVGGSLEVNSSRGRGTRIRVTISSPPPSPHRGGRASRSPQRRARRAA